MQEDFQLNAHSADDRRRLCSNLHEEELLHMACVPQSALQPGDLASTCLAKAKTPADTRKEQLSKIVRFRPENRAVRRLLYPRQYGFQQGRCFGRLAVGCGRDRREPVPETPSYEGDAPWLWPEAA